MPDYALAALNAWALNTGVGKVDFSFTRDGREIKLEQVEIENRHEKYERQLELPLMQSRYLMQWNHSQMSLSRRLMSRQLKVDLVKVDSPTTRWFAEQLQ